MKIRCIEREKMLRDQIVLALIIMAVITIIVVYVFMTPHVCDALIYRKEDGSLELQPSGRWFPDMNAFQQWWAANHNDCKLPILKGGKKHEVLEEPVGEQTYAKTPIYKVDDYEFSRVYGYERNGRMEVPRQNFNVLLNKRAFDWADRPLSSDERRQKYAGLTEGFTAAGEFTSVDMDDVAREVAARYGERSKRKDDEDRCNRKSREDREVALMIAKAYESDPEYEPVVTKVGPHHWEVNELKPIVPQMATEDPDDNRIVDTANDAVDIGFEYRQKEVIDNAIDPYFPEHDRAYNEPNHKAKPKSDPYNGYVPGLERMFGPTFDHVKWY
jgi:hypothetical protein